MTAALTRPAYGGNLIRRIPVARKPVVEINCGRCGGTEYVNAATTVFPDEVEFSVTLGGETTTFEDLCSSCRKAVSNYVSHIVSYRSKAKEKAGSESLPDTE